MTFAARHLRLLPYFCALSGLVAALALAAAPSAKARPAATAPSCPSSSQVFARWGDYAYYAPVPGGAFESGMPAWSLSGGARVVAGNESFYVRSRTDSKSLSLPGGAAALSPSMCFGLGDWHARFFVRNVGSTRGSLRVDIVTKGLLGIVSILDGGSVSGTGVWAPSPRIGLTLTNVTSLLGVNAVAFRFRSVGTGAAFQVDDVYLDPWKSF